MDTKESKKKLGRRLVAARVQADISAVELAAQIGKSVGALRSWEAGRFSPKHNDVIRLSEVLGKPPAWFYGEEELPAESIVMPVDTLRQLIANNDGVNYPVIPES